MSNVSVAARWHHGIDNIYIISVAGHVDNPEDGIKYKKITAALKPWIANLKFKEKFLGKDN